MSEGLLFKGGQVVDGTGAPSFVGDVLVREGQIKEISRGAIEANAQQIDCTGKVVAPGFIDLHSHMEGHAARGSQRDFDSFTRQGVTSYVGGNCGFSSFGYKSNSAYKSLLSHGVFPNGEGGGDYEDFVQALEQNGVKSKMTSLAGHCTTRASISGYQARALAADELDELLGLLGRAMDDGAAGVSLGLQYKPGIFAPHEELVQVAKLVKARDKILTVHARAYSNFSGTYPMVPFGRAHNLKAIDDMLGLARETGVRLQFSHLILVGSQTWKNVDEVIELFDQAIAQGVDVKFDMFSYPCGATLLSTFMSDWFMAKMPGSLDNLVDLARLRAEVFIGFKVVGFGFDDMQITSANCPEYSQFDGLFVPDIAARVGKSNFATVIDIVKCSGALAKVLNHSYYSQGVIEQLMQHRAAIFASDAWSEPGGTNNPAAYSNFPRFLEVARDKGLVPVEDMVHRMSGAAADRLGMKGRGTLSKGSAGDLVVFDPSTVKANSTIEKPQADPSGIHHVIIDGERMLEDGNILA